MDMGRSGHTFLRSLLPGRDNFTAHVLTLLSGTSLAQFLVILTAPILTRLYTPEDFGVLALFVSLNSIVGAVICGRYEMAIMLPREEEDAANLFALALVVAIGLSVLALGVIAAFGQSLAQMLHCPSLSFWLWFLPVGYLFAGLSMTLNYWHTRKKKYFGLAAARVSQSVGTVGVQTGAGLTATTGAGGLIAGELMGQAVGIGVLGLDLVRRDGKVIWQSLHPKKMGELAKNYHRFPAYDVAAVLANTGSHFLPFLLLNQFFDAFVVGSFYLAYRVINWPLNLIGTSVSQVFYQKYEEKRQESEKLKFLQQLIKILAILALLPALVLFISAPYLFQVIFGPQWLTAGEFVRILAPLLFIRFIVGPLSSVFWSEGRNAWFLFCQLLLLCTTVAAFLVGGILGKVNLALIFYSGANCLVYILIILLALKFAGYRTLAAAP